MRELMVLARLRDSITKLMGLFQRPNFFVEVKHTGELERDVLGKLVPKLEVGKPCPDDEQIAKWIDEVKEAYKELQEDLPSCKSCVESKRAKFIVEHTEVTLKAFEENTLPRLVEIASSNSLYFYIEGLRQRQHEVESLLNQYELNDNNSQEDGSNTLGKESEQASPTDKASKQVASNKTTIKASGSSPLTQYINVLVCSP